MTDPNSLTTSWMLDPFGRRTQENCTTQGACPITAHALEHPELDGQIADTAVSVAFDRLEPELAAFAERHSLFVRKYIHNYPMWGFYFRHPSDGRGSVQLSIARTVANEFTVTIGGEWHVDNETQLTRSTYAAPLENLRSIAPELLVSKLDDMLRLLLTASASARSQMSPIMPRPRDESGKPVYGEFERALQVAK